MGFTIAFRRSPEHRAEYHHERENHLASFAAEAIVLVGYELLEIHSDPASYPLTIDDIFARERAKAAYRQALGTNPYLGEEAFVIERFRAVHPN